MRININLSSIENFCRENVHLILKVGKIIFSILIIINMWFDTDEGSCKTCVCQYSLGVCGTWSCEKFGKCTRSFIARYIFYSQIFILIYLPREHGTHLQMTPKKISHFHNLFLRRYEKPCLLCNEDCEWKEGVLCNEK